MIPGSMVLFTAKHWDWLVNAGRQHPKQRRETIWGIITDVDYTGDCACVHWHGGGYTWHFADNLETP